MERFGGKLKELKKNLNQDSERTRPRAASETSTAEMNGARGQDAFSRVDFVVQHFNIYLQKWKGRCSLNITGQIIEVLLLFFVF